MEWHGLVVHLLATGVTVAENVCLKTFGPENICGFTS